MSCVFFSNFTCLLLRQSASFGSSFLWILAAVNLHIQHTTQQHSTVSYTVSLYKLYWSNENHHTNMETVNQFCQFDFTISWDSNGDNGQLIWDSIYKQMNNLQGSACMILKSAYKFLLVWLITLFLQSHLCALTCLADSGITIVERLCSSNLVVTVLSLSPTVLRIHHFRKGTEICRHKYEHEILAVRLNPSVCALLYVFDWNCYEVFLVTDM